MAPINIDSAETFWTPLAVVAQLEWWFGYSGPHHFTCTTCNARIEIRENGSFLSRLRRGLGRQTSSLDRRGSPSA